MKKRRILALYMAVLMAFSGYVMADTFLISRAYGEEASSGAAGTEAAGGNETAGGNEDQAEGSASAGEGNGGQDSAAGDEEAGKQDGTADDEAAGNQHSGSRGGSGDGSGMHGGPGGGGGHARGGPGKGHDLGKDGGSASDAADSADDTDNTDNANNADDADDTKASSGGQTVSAAGTTNSYSDENIRVTLKEYRENDTTIHVADVTLSDPSYLKTALAQGTYGRNITAKTSEIAESVGAVLAVNGDFYGAQEKGYVIRNGTLYRDAALENQEDLVIYKDGSFGVINESSITAEELIKKGAVQTLSFGPALVQNGSVTVTEKEEVGMAMASNPRTAIGIIDEDHYVFVVSDGRTDESEGLSLSELAEFMASLGAETAYNLDGGGSSTMYFNGSIVNDPTTGGRNSRERSVSDIVYIG